MDQHLAKDERILFALSRPALKSERERTWVGRRKLNEGVLILTNQRLISLVELIPLERSAVRYGFETQMGAIERLRDFKVAALGNENILLQTFWAAEGGRASLEFELSKLSMPEIGELQCFLDRIIAETKSSCALRRIAPLENPDELPDLKDLSTNDPEDLDQNLRILSDPAAGINESILIPHQQIAALQYSASILESSIGFTALSDGKVQTKQYPFPFPAENAFQQCFEALRRYSASVPFRECR